MVTLTPASLLSNVSQVFDLLTRSALSDSVAVYDQETLQQVFATARPVKLEVREDSRIMDFPVETGSTLSDNIVIMPNAIEAAFFISADNYSQAYQSFRNAKARATVLSVQTRLGVYSNMIIYGLSHEEDPEMFDAAIVQVRFREVQYIFPSSFYQQTNFKTITPSFQNVIQRGLQIPSIVTKQVGSILSYAKLGRIFGRKL